MIKQTRTNPSDKPNTNSEASTILIWKLMQLCLERFHPEKNSVKLAVFSHVAEHVDKSNAISEIAIMILEKFVKDLLSLRTGRLSKPSVPKMTLAHFHERVNASRISNSINDD